MINQFAEVNNINTSGFSKKLNTMQINQMQKRKLVMQTNICDTSGLVKKTDQNFNGKITEI